MATNELTSDMASVKIYSLKVLENGIKAYDASAAITLQSTTSLIMVTASTDCHIAFDEAATTNHYFLPANTPVSFPVYGATTIRAIKAATAGNLYALELGL